MIHPVFIAEPSQLDAGDGFLPPFAQCMIAPAATFDCPLRACGLGCSDAAFYLHLTK